jgi:hypothetical protein
MRANAGCEKHSVDSRQQASARIRRETFAKINRDYGPEPRHARRGIALTLSRKIRKGFLAGMREKKGEKGNG